jgi:peptidyl-dipeptidase A
MEIFVRDHVQKLEPLLKQAKLAYWEAATSGRADAYDTYAKLELELRRLYSDPRAFRRLKASLEKNVPPEPRLARQVRLLYNAHLENQIEPALLEEMVALSAQVDKRFATFRPTLGGKSVTDNDIKQILKTETDSARRREAWQAGKQVGEAVAADIVALVRLRNRAASSLGFDTYHDLALAVAEQEREELDGIFAELRRLTDAPFAAAKADLDRLLAERYGLAPEELLPWHYHDPFFQEAPAVEGLDFNAFYAERSLKELAATFYAGIGLPVEDILARSDLYEREGKNPHAFCDDIDRRGDVRILCNLRNTERWMGTLLHELGHAVYDTYHDSGLPFLLREPAHIFTTEAVAMFFGRLSSNAAWMQSMLGLSDARRREIERASGRYARLKQLVFARWAMVMYAFEKELYRDPDQDLNGLWWRTVETYQLVRRPPGRDEPDWAAKIHLAAAPCYYHNYMLGELLASQFRLHLQQTLPAGGEMVGSRQAGAYFREHVFAPGNLYHWNEMIRRATGEELSARHYAAEFVQPYSGSEPGGASR